MIDHLVDLCEKKQKELLEKKFEVLQKKVRKVKGTNDLFGKEILAHNFIEEHFIRACKSFNFKQISTPILEHSDIFTRSSDLPQTLFLRKCIILWIKETIVWYLDLRELRRLLGQ